MDDDKGRSSAKVGRRFVKFLQNKIYAYYYEHYMGISTRTSTSSCSYARPAQLTGTTLHDERLRVRLRLSVTCKEYRESTVATRHC